MKKIVLSMFVSLVLILVACTQNPVSDPPENSDLTKIRLPMGYIPNIQFSPFYVSAEKGFFREEGLEIEFDYSFETDGVALVGGNELQFSLVSGEQVLLARAQGLPVVYVATWWQEYPVAVISKVDAGIETPQDLVGKQVGLPGLFGANYIGFRAILQSAGIPEEQITLNSIGFNQVEALATDQQDAVVIYINNEPVQLKAQGFDLNIISVTDYVQLASNGLLTNEITIAQNPDLVGKMVRAMLRGVRYTSTYPDEAYDISLKYVENLAQADRAVQEEILEISIGLWQIEKNGVTDPQSWENMHQTLLDMGLLTEPLDLNKAYSNEFVR